MAYENGVSFRAVIMAKPQGEREREAGRCLRSREEGEAQFDAKTSHCECTSLAEGDERRASDDLHADEARRHALQAASKAHMTQCDDDDDARSLLEVSRPQSGEHRNRGEAGSLTRRRLCTMHKYS